MRIHVRSCVRSHSVSFIWVSGLTWDSPIKTLTGMNWTIIDPYIEKYHLIAPAGICSERALSCNYTQTNATQSRGYSTDMLVNRPFSLYLWPPRSPPLPNGQLTVPGPLINFRAPPISSEDRPHGGIDRVLHCGWQFVCRILLRDLQAYFITAVLPCPLSSRTHGGQCKVYLLILPGGASDIQYQGFKGNHQFPNLEICF
jgi:hypothetical protein